MTTRPIELPLVQGRHDEIDRQLLPQGMLSAAENYRIAKTGKLIRREGYTHTPPETAAGIFVGCGNIYQSERGALSTAIDYIPRLMRLGDRRLCYAETYGRDDLTCSNGGPTLLLERTQLTFQAVTPVEYPTHLQSAAMTSPLCTAPQAWYRFRPEYDVVSTSCAVHGNYLIVATGYGVIGVVWVQWVDLLTGSVVTTREYSSTTFGGGYSWRECRVVVSGNIVLLYLRYVDGANHLLGVDAFDGANHYEYMSFEGSIAALSASAPTWDVCEMRGAAAAGRVALAFYNATGGTAVQIYGSVFGWGSPEQADVIADTPTEGVTLDARRETSDAATQRVAVVLSNSGGATKLYTYVGALSGGASNAATIGTGATLSQGAMSCEIWSYPIHGFRVACAVTGDITPTGYTSPTPVVWLSRWTIVAAGSAPTQEDDYRNIIRASVAGRMRDQQLWCQYSTRSDSQQRQYLLYAVVTGPKTAANQDLLLGGPLVARCGWRVAGGTVDGLRPLAPPVVYGEDILWPAVEVYDGELSIASGSENRDGCVVYRYSQKNGKRAPWTEIGGLQIFGGSHRCVDGLREVVPPYCYPEAENTWCATSGAGSLSGTAYYKIVYAIRDSHGNVWRSAPSRTIEEGGLSSNSVVLRVEGFGMQTDGPLVAEVYRQHTDGTYRLAEKGNIGSTGYAQITDAGDTLSSRPLLYTTGGEPESFPTPPSDVCAAWNGRLWVALEDQLYYSHQYDFADGSAAGPYTVETFYVQFPEHVTALAALDTVLLVFTASSIYALSGDGPNRLGQGVYTRSHAVLLSSEVGCVDSRSVVKFRDGVAFQSARGLEIVPRGGGAPQPFGDPVSDVLAAYNEVSSAVVIPEHDQIRWTLVTPGGTNTTGKIVVYDYGEGQWLTETAPAFDDAIVWDGAYVLAGAGAPVLNEYEGGVWTQGGRYTDHKPAGNVAYTAYLETGDIHPAGLRGWCRVAKIDVLGTVVGAADLVISIAYNGSSSFGESGTVSWASGVVMQEHAPAYGKFESIRVKLSDASTSAGVALHALVLHAQAKHGGGRLPSARRT